MSTRRVRITKASGEETFFSERKLRASLEKSGASGSAVDQVVEQLNPELEDGITTSQIYRRAYRLLKKQSRSQAARYKLKKAIMELGPSGYPFERFIGAMLEVQGYRVEVGVLLSGKCVTHEIDVLAQKNNKIILAECKFHNRPGVKCDVKIPLYIHSRFRDVAMGFQQKDISQHAPCESWIVTNTRFTEDAIRYGTCSGMVMLGWDFPHKNNLKQRIGQSGLHPVTCLSSLNRSQKTFVLDKGIVLCRTLLDNPDLIRDAGLSDSGVEKVRRECEELVYELNVPSE